MLVSQYYVTHVVTKLQFVTYSVTLSRLASNWWCMRPAPSRDIPLAMFVSARIRIITITPVMIVTMVCSVTNYPLSHHNADTAALARYVGHDQKRGKKHLCTSNFSTCQFFNPTNLSSAVRVVPRNITVHSSPYFRSVAMWWCLFLRLCGWDIIDTPHHNCTGETFVLFYLVYFTHGLG